MNLSSYRKNYWRRKIWVPAVLGIYLIYLFISTLAPFDFSLFYFKQFFSSNFTSRIAFIFHVKVPDVVNNILLFLPFGMLLFFLIRGDRTKRTKIRLWIPIFAGALLSMFIEGAQLFLERSTSIIDIITNTTGTALGFYVMGRWDWPKRLFLVIHRIWQKFSFRFISTLLYTAFFIALMLLPLKINNLKNWDENFHLLIGNEETLDRPWEGEVSLVAIYKKSLSLSEIRTFYKSGMNNIKERSANGAVVVYSFSEDTGDTLNDFSGVGEPLFLIGRNVKWSKSGRGVIINDSNFLRSILPARKIVHALRRTSQMAIEVWLRTENLTQTGPGRIVSLSSSPDERNFTLGQNREDIHFRVRTPLTGPNGSRICLKTRSVLKDRETHHIAATFNRGVERLVIDGRPCGAVRGDIDYLPYLLRMGSALTGKLAFVFVFVFPLGLFFYSLFPRYRFVLALISVGAIVSLIEIFYFFYTGQPFGFFFFLTSLVISGLSGIVGSIIERSICQQ